MSLKVNCKIMFSSVLIGSASSKIFHLDLAAGKKIVRWKMQGNGRTSIVDPRMGINQRYKCIGDNNRNSPK